MKSIPRARKESFRITILEERIKYIAGLTKVVQAATKVVEAFDADDPPQAKNMSLDMYSGIMTNDAAYVKATFDIFEIIKNNLLGDKT